MALKERGAVLTLHNYVPFWDRAYVLNLASQSEDIVNTTVNHVRKAIDLSARIDSKYYAFHAGYLIDPRPEELGKKISARAFSDRTSALRVFRERIEGLAEYAKSLGVNLLVENNVISHNNYQEFNGNPLLMCDPDEICTFFNSLNGEVGLLLDFAHLKVSCNTLGIDLEHAFRTVEPYVRGLHLSDNNGLADQNLEFDSSAWFLDKLDKFEYRVLEVYEYSDVTLRKHLDLIDEHL